MDHLTVDQIIDVVSLTKLNKEAAELSAAVNGHIRRCDKCLRLVRAFQMIYDEFSQLSTSGDFRKYILTAVQDVEIEQNTPQMQSQIEDHR